MTSPIACTIVSNNYIAHARVFAKSFLRHNSKGAVYTLIVDEKDPRIEYGGEPFSSVFVQELDIPSFRHLAFKYSILELNTAVKPFFLKYLYEKCGHTSLCYFDPDILVTSPLAELYSQVENHQLVLIPHITAPIGDDDAGRPNERELLAAGVYNLGFLGISFTPETLAFLDWWASKMPSQCLSRPDLGLFVDQRWMDFAPAFVPRTLVLRDPGYNVAYWNVVHHRLRQEGPVWLTGAHRLRFFHFSGYDLDKPAQMSKHQNRIELSRRADLIPIYAVYAKRLKTEGFDAVRPLPYAYARFANEVTIPASARESLRLTDPNGTRWTDPFECESPDSFFSWLNGPVPTADGTVLTRLALTLWDQRPDLQSAFPRPTGADAKSFATWFGEGEECQIHIDEAFLLPVRNALRATATNPETTVSRPADEHRFFAEEADHEPGRKPRIPRAAMRIHKQRSDVASLFPDPFGVSREDFAVWYVTHGQDEYRLPLSLFFKTFTDLRIRLKGKVLAWWAFRLFRGSTPPAQRDPSKAALPESGTD